MKKRTLTIIASVVAVIVVSGFIFAIQSSQINNPFKSTNNSTNFNATNTTNNSTLSNQTQNQTNNNPPPPPPEISSEKAKELAQKYVGPGTNLGKPVLTTYKSFKAWQVPVYTVNHKFINNIYIDAKTGKRVD